MKYIILLADGMADRPVAELGGKTPLEAAHTPNMDAVFAASACGMVTPLVKGYPLGSDVGNMTILGNDPSKHYTGRAAFEAANLKIELAPSEVAYRCNLVHVKDGIMEDYSAGHITTKEAKELIQLTDKMLGSKGCRFYPGKSYRHIMVMKGGENMKSTPPHDITGKNYEEYLPSGPKSQETRELMKQSLMFLEGHEINRARRAEGKKTANMIWLWGQGRKLDLPKLKDKYGLEGAVISAVDLVNGIGVSMGLEVIDVPGATGYIDSNFLGKAEYAVRALKKKDFVYLHVEAPDEMGHNGDAKGKIFAVEKFDAEVVGPVMKGMKAFKEYRVMITSDHSTPVEVRTHTEDSVPYLLYDSRKAGKNELVKYSEAAARARRGRDFETGWELFEHFIKEA